MKAPTVRHGIRPAAIATIAAGLLACLTGSALSVASETTVGVNPAETGRGGSALSIDSVDGLIALQAQDASLQEVLIGIARHCDLQLMLQHSLDARISLSLQPLPLAELLMRLLRQQSYVLQLSARDEGMRAPGRGKSGTLWVFSEDSSESTGHRYIEVGDRRAEDALLLALESGDRGTRVEAMHELASIGGDGIVARLAAATGDDDAWVREEANNALGGIGSDLAIGQLEKSLRDADRDVREAAILALAEIGGEETISSLATALQDPDPSLRLEVVESLAEIGGASVMHLLDVALQDPDSDVRQAATDLRAELIADSRD
jgi:hypothetical protein